MSSDQPYTSTIRDMPFLFPEMRRTARLLCEGKTRDEIIRLSLQSNIYQLEKERRRRDLPSRLIKRLQTIETTLVSIVANGREEDAKLIAFLALIKSDRLFFEFMREIYLYKFKSGQREIDDKDFFVFLEGKEQTNDIVAGWKARTFEGIRSTYKKVLCEAGLVKKDGEKLIIRKPICDQGLLTLLRGENEPFAKAMLLEV